MERFSDLPMSSKALYFLLGMEADDEGFVSPKRVMKLYGGHDDDLNVLILKNLIIPFNSGVIVITDWNSNNWLDSRRLKPTKYQEERKLLALNKDKSYLLSTGLASARLEERRGEENRGEEKRIEESSFNEIPKEVRDKVASLGLSKRLN